MTFYKKFIKDTEHLQITEKELTCRNLLNQLEKTEPECVDSILTSKNAEDRRAREHAGKEAFKEGFDGGIADGLYNVDEIIKTAAAADPAAFIKNIKEIPEIKAFLSKMALEKKDELFLYPESEDEIEDIEEVDPVERLGTSVR